jgi:hypothetical protein
LCLVLAGAVGVAAARAEERFVSVRLTDVQATPTDALKVKSGASSDDRAELFPRIVLETGGEAYFKSEREDTGSYWSVADLLTDARLAIRTTKAGEIRGHLFFPNEKMEGQTRIAFTIPEKAQGRENNARETYFQAKEAYYRILVQSDLPGAAWFRHQENAASKALGKPKRTAGRTRGNINDNSEFGILTGGRALAENLQLDRALQAPDSDKPAVELSTLEGITVRQFHWAPLVKDLKPALDPLAALVPHDQHAMFLPSAEALATFITEAGRTTLPVLDFMDNGGGMDDRLGEKYGKQLCLPLADLPAKLPGELLTSIAVTGSDPSFRSGTGVTILFEGRDPEALHAKLTRLIAESAAGHAEARAISGTQGSLDFTGFRSPDRAVCVYISKLPGGVAVTNSPQQLEVLDSVQSKKAPSLQSLEEFTYFRHRYPRAEQQESAFLMISDPTIRRWCGPKLRIAWAHTTRAAAVLAELNAATLENPEAPLEAPAHLNLGKLTRVNGQVVSENYNTLGFLTPAEEMKFSKVSDADAEGYKRWRDTYQQNWRAAFDPIALRLSLQRDKLAADLTVMPLIENSTYRTGQFHYLQGKFAPDAADPHRTIAQLVLGLDATKPPLSNILPTLLPLGAEKGANPFRWLGNNASVFLDEDPFWAELAKAEKAERFLEKNVGRLPVGVRLASNNPLGLAAFLTALRGYAETAAPGMIQYTLATHNKQPYVKVTASKEMMGDMEFALYYVPFPDALLVTLNEPLLKRAIDRRNGAGNATQAASQPAEKPGPWLGQTMAGHVDAELIRMGVRASGGMGLSEQHQRAWAPLPLLNDLKRLHPSEDAIALYHRSFRTTPTDPLGGSYVWDEKEGSYKSTHFGSPTAPAGSFQFHKAIQTLRTIDFGITLDDNNLRARVILQREP